MTTPTPELVALRIQEWLFREHDLVVSVQEVERASDTPLACRITEDSFTRAAALPQGVLDDVMREALSEVIRATRAYLPPDGISPQDCISRVLAATDNARINAAMGEVS